MENLANSDFDGLCQPELPLGPISPGIFFFFCDMVVVVLDMMRDYAVTINVGPRPGWALHS